MYRRFAVLLALLAALLPPLAAHAEDKNDPDHDRALKLRERGDIVPLEGVVRQAREIQPGTIIEVELEEEHKRLLYEVEVLDAQGVVWELEFDARTGKEVRRGKED